jgi:hypothetical protein
MAGSLGSRLVALVLTAAVALGLLWFAAWLLDIVLGPFTPLLAAVAVAGIVLLVLGQRGG